MSIDNFCSSFSRNYPNSKGFGFEGLCQCFFYLLFYGFDTGSTATDCSGMVFCFFMGRNAQEGALLLTELNPAS